MEVDAGASMSLMSEFNYRRLWPRRSLSPSEVRLCNYSKQPITVVGQCDVYKGQQAAVPLMVVSGTGPTLLGRNWLQHIRLDWASINVVVNHSGPVQSVLDRHSIVFQEGLGTLKWFHAKIQVSPEARPRFFKARVVPYAMREKVELELQRLQQEGTNQ